MGKLSSKISKRLMAAALTVAMVMSNMTVYAGELDMPYAEVQSDIAADTDDAVLDVTGDSAETPEDETTSGDDSLADEVTDGTVGDGGESDEEGGDISDPEDEPDSEEENLDLEEGETEEEDEDILVEEEKPLKDASSENKTEEIVHFVDASAVAKTETGKDKAAFPTDQTFAEGYFKVVESVKQGIASDAPYCFHIDSKGKGAIKFTVAGTADVEIEASSNSSDNTSYIALADSSQEIKKANEAGTVTNVPSNESKTGLNEVKGKNRTKITYTAIGAGEYVIYCNGPDSSINGRDVKVYTIKVTETIVERGPWADAAAPSIASVTPLDGKDKGKISVTVSADIGDNGGDKLDVEMYKGSSASGAPADTQSTRTKGEEHTLTFAPADSGEYCFVAKLSRAAETDIKTSSVSSAVTVSVPLAVPQNLKVTENIEEESLTSVTFSWDGVKGADYYKVAVTEQNAAQGTAPLYQNNNVSKSAKNITITAQEANLERGKTYIFSLTAVRTGTGADGGDEEVSAAMPKKISSGDTSARTYVFNPSTMEDTEYMAKAKASEGGPAHGTKLGTDNYFSVGIYNDAGHVVPAGQYANVRRDVRAGIEFTVEGTAIVTVDAASTGDTNTTPVEIRKIKNTKPAGKQPDFDSTPILEKDGKTAVSGKKKPTTLTWELEAGTYTLVAPEGTDASGNQYKSNLSVYSITVKETSNRAERTDLQLVTKPEVTNVVNNNDGTLSVTVDKAPVGYDGGDRMVVVLVDSNGNEVSGVRGAAGIEGSTHTVSVKINSCETGNYTVKAKLVRGVGSDKEELVGDVTKSFDYIQEIQDPTALYASNKGRTDSGSGSVQLSWNAASGAQYYIIKVIDSDGTETNSISTQDSATSYIVNTGLTIGQKYTFEVYAASELNGEVYKSQNAARVENYEIIEGEGDRPFDPGKYELRVNNDLGVFAASTKQDGEMQRVGTSNFFTVIYNSSSKVEKESQTFTDGTSESAKLSFNSSARTTGGAVKFAISGPSRVTVYWKAAADGREMQIIDDTYDIATDNPVKVTNIGTTKDTAYVSKLYLDKAGIYYLGNRGGNNYIYKVVVDNGSGMPTRPEWDEVPDPVISDVKQVKGDITLKVKAKIGSEGANAEADKVEVTMYDKDGKAVGSAKTVLEGAVDPTLTITPEASGEYRFKAQLSRNDESLEEKTSEYPSNNDEYFKYVLPLETPVLEKANVVNKGAVDEAKQYGSAEISWESVKEADRYIVKVSGKDTEYEKEYIPTVPAILIDEGLIVGKTYNFTVTAQRDASGTFDDAGELIEPETTKASSSQSLKIEADFNRKWNFVVYGIGTSRKESGFVAKDGTQASDKKDSAGKPIYSSGYTVMKPDGVTPNPAYGDDGKVEPKPADLADDEFLRLWTWNGKGKIVPGDTDGLAFYYTEVNPNTSNFKLSANLHVNQWRIGNGQEGFGLLAADWIGADGDTEYHWTNSYTAVVSKVDYKWDSVNDRWSTTEGDGVTLRLGIGSTAKTGVTAANLPIFENDVTTATTQYYKTETLPLETSVHTSLYDNIIGNETLGSTKMWTNPIVDLKLSIELNATGYYVTYTPLTKNADGSFTEGTPVTNKYYDRNALTMCEENTAYIGFFATRYADVTFSNVDLTTSRYNPDDPKETPPVEEVKLKASVSGASTANSEDYNLIYSANWKGTVTIEDEAGAVLAQENIAPRDGDLTEEGKITVPVKLHIGTNKFKATYTPDREYEPYGGNPPVKLTSYDSKVDTVTVNWKKYGKEGDILYVSPKGKATGDGTKVNPLDVYTAVKYAQPGQTIYLVGGTYNLTQTVKIDRGVNGTEEKKIYMLADPETCKNGVRPVFDFNSQCPAMVVAGDWWYLQGFDVTRSGNQMKGLQVSGNHNTLDGLNIYKNGSTGLQISRLLSSDKFDDWPSYNLILNCTSVLNADAGYTDADGFAAKLTVGNGNVFDGCISAYNADDGWDLFAKVWTGPIGVVTIRNSVSFENGQVIRDKITHELVWFNESDNWEIVGSGNNNSENAGSGGDGEEGEEDDKSYEIIDAGSGNGYKMGGSSITGYHRLENSVAFHNKAKGIDSNSCNDIQAFNSISYDNASYNIAMYSNATKTDFAASGVISYRKNVGMENEDRIGIKDKSTESSIIKSQEDCVEKIFNNTNFFWNKLLNVSEPGSEYYQHYTTCTNETTGKGYKPSITVADDWFVSLDYEKWEKNYCLDTPIRLLGRAADGSGRIDLHGFLELSETGKAKMAAAGAKTITGLGAGTESKDAEDFLDKVTGETSGNINTGGEKDNTGKNEEGIAADDFSQMPGNAEEVGIWFAIVDRDKLEYTGKALKPEVRVYSGNVRLKKGKDYTVTYKNNLNAYVGAYNDAYYKEYSELYSKYTDVELADLKAAYSKVDPKKKPTIIVKAKGNYKNVAKDVTQVCFDINPVTIDPKEDAMNRIGMSDIALISKTSAQKVNPVVTFNNKKLSSAKDKDYSFKVYSYSTGDNDEVIEKPVTDAKVSAAGAYKVEIEGKNNFAGKTAIQLNVVDGKDSNALASGFKLKKKIPDKCREGYNAVSVDEEVPLPVTLSTDGANADLIVTDKNNKQLKEVEKDEDGKYKYTNTETDADGNSATVYTGQYTVSYKNNIDIGTATVIVTAVPGAGYYGSKEFKFRIVAPTLNKMLKDKEAKLIDTTNLEWTKDDDGMLKITTAESGHKLFGDNHSYQYEGKAVDPVNDELVDSSGNSTKLGLAVKRGGSWYLLVQGKDYKLAYKNNTKQGNASAVFKGIGNYKGSVTQKFKITPFDLDKKENRMPAMGEFDGAETVSKIGGTFEVKGKTTVNADDTKDITYTGSVFKDASPAAYKGLEVAYNKGGVKPAVSLTINGNPLKVGQDYTVTYKNNSKPTESGTPDNKKPAIIIKGKNGLKGTLTGIFTISKKDFDDKAAVIKVTAQDVRISKSTGKGYEGSYKTRIVVKDAQGKALSAGTDYDKNIKYEIVDNATHKTVIKDVTKDKTVTIEKNDPDQYLTIRATVYPKKDGKFYTGSTQGISTYYRVLYAKNSIRKSTFVVNYSAAKNDITCFYEPTADGKAFYYYEGGIKLNDSLLTVKLDNKKLAWGEDFEVVKYVGNNKQGTAKLTIQGKGKYFDTKVITFRIMPKEFKWWEKVLNPTAPDDSNKPKDPEDSKKPEE